MGDERQARAAYGCSTGKAREKNGCRTPIEQARNPSPVSFCAQGRKPRRDPGWSGWSPAGGRIVEGEARPEAGIVDGGSGMKRAHLFTVACMGIIACADDPMASSRAQDKGN